MNYLAKRLSVRLRNNVVGSNPVAATQALVYLCPYLGLGLFISYLRDLFFIFHFHCN